MTIAFRSSNQNAVYNAGTTGITVTKPSGLADGDVLVAFISAGDDPGGDFTCSGWTNPSGYSGASSYQTTPGNDGNSAVLIKVVTDAASEPSSYTFVNTNSGNINIAGFVAAFSGVDNSTPIDDIESTTGTNDWTPTVDALTTVVDGEMMVTCHAGLIGGASSKTAGAPSGMTLVGTIAESRNTGLFISSEMAYAIQTTAGTFSPGSWTGTPDDSSSEWHKYTIALNPSSVAAYELWSAGGSFALSGQNATLLRDLLTLGGAGSFALSGQNALLLKAFPLLAGNGNFGVTGEDALMLLDRLTLGQVGSFSLTGYDAILDYHTLTNYLLQAGQGDFILAGNSSLLLSRLMTSGEGSFAVTGENALLLRQLLTLAQDGAFILSGYNAILEKTIAGAYSLLANGGAFLLTANDALLLPGRQIRAGAGNYALTGESATILATRLILGQTGGFNLSGTSQLIYTPLAVIYHLLGDTGSFVLTGENGKLLSARIVVAQPGDFALTGQDALELVSRLLRSSGGDYAFDGLSQLHWSGELAAYVMQTETGTFVISGDSKLVYYLPTTRNFAFVTGRHYDDTENARHFIYQPGETDYER